MHAARPPADAAPPVNRPPSHERHVVERIGWLRAAVLGANDGIVSTSALIVGVAASAADKPAILIAGVASLVAGAMSMAAGEYVSVSSQSDAEEADLATERRELEQHPQREFDELVSIYRDRGLDEDLARQVATQLTARDALQAHARDELGINEAQRARPLQAAITSALTFAAGAALPLLAAWLLPRDRLVAGVAALSLVFLVLLGVIGARAGRSPVLRATARVTFWGAAAMAATVAIGRLFGTAVG